MKYGNGVGRGRALEIVLGANDFDGDTAAQYGYVNRALPDEELDGFVDALARRIATFDGRAIAAAKHLINQVSLPSADNLLSALNSFQFRRSCGFADEPGSSQEDPASCRSSARAAWTA